MLCLTILFHHPVCVCVLHLSCVYVVTSSSHHSIFGAFTNQSPSHSFYLTQFISLISLIIVHHFDINLIQSYFPDRSRSIILLKYIHSFILTSRLMHQILISRTYHSPLSVETQKVHWKLTQVTILKMLFEMLFDNTKKCLSKFKGFNKISYLFTYF